MRILRRLFRPWIVYLSLLFGLFLAAVPVPPWMLSWWPDWPLLVFIYWGLALPEQLGVAAGWMLGLLVDVYRGDLLGRYALCFALVGGLVQGTYRYMRHYPLPQQSLMVALFVLFYLVVDFLILNLRGTPPRHWSFWLPALTSLLVWPWLFLALRMLRRRYLRAR